VATEVSVAVVAVVVATVLPEQKALVATHRVAVVLEEGAEVDVVVVAAVVIKEVEAEVEALGHQVWGLLETQYSEVPHLLISASRPPAR